MCAMAFVELHSIVIHRLYSRSFVLAGEGRGKKALSLEKKKRDSLHLQRSNLIESTLPLFRDKICDVQINFSRFCIYIYI